MQPGRSLGRNYASLPILPLTSVTYPGGKSVIYTYSGCCPRLIDSITDRSGNVEAVLDASQQLAAAYRYDPFGNLLAQSGSLRQPFGFSTRRYDMKTGLLHYQQGLTQNK